MIVHGGDIYTYIAQTGIAPLDYSANINPLGLPDSVKKVIADSMDCYSSYPDVLCRDLKKSVSQFQGVQEDFLIFGNGAADIIFRTVYAIKPKNALLLAPTFSEYEAALANVSCKINYHKLFEQNNFALSEEILESICGVDMVFICNPNNPTGMVTSKELIYKIAQKCRTEKALLVIDECFLDFVEDYAQYSFKEFITEFENVIILKAFTKIFAMAGLRLGYGISSNERLLWAIKRAGQPWNVSTPAQLAGITACSEIDYVNKTIRLIRAERQYLSNGLRKAGIKVFDSYANYILIKAHRDLYRRLLKGNILIRRCENYVGLDDTYFRLAVKCHEDNKKLMGVINNG